MLGRDIKIKIDGGNDQAFFPGAPIHGNVSYRATANDRLTAVNLDLRGVIRVSPTKKGTNAAANLSKPQTEHVELFHIMEKIVLEPIWTERRTLTWSFTIVLPEFTGPDRSNNVYTDAGNPLFEEMPHPLPPSMGSDQSNEVEIVYHMFAVAKRSFRGYGATEQLQEAPVVHNIPSLLYCPDPHVDSDSPILTTHKEWELVSAAQKPRRFSLKPSSTNSSLEQGQGGGPPPVVEVKIPASVILGKPVGVALSVSTETATKSSQVILRSLSAYLRALTHRRTAKTPYNPALTEIRTKKLGGELSRGNAVLGTSGITQLFSTDALGSWPPTFRSYSVSRAYELVIEAAVAKGKEEFKREFTEEVEVSGTLSEHDAARRASVAPPALPVLGPRADEPLPGYDD